MNGYAILVILFINVIIFTGCIYISVKYVRKRDQEEWAFVFAILAVVGLGGILAALDMALNWNVERFRRHGPYVSVDVQSR